MNISSDILKKLTIAKSPFTERTRLPTDIRKQQIRDLKPNQNFHNFHTIQWLRRKCSENVIKKSISTLFPNNGCPIIDHNNESKEKKRLRLRRDWLLNHAKPKNNFQNVSINPKYFFNQKTFEKILKLREIFLEFDDDGSRQMEINEIEEMFNTNKIEASIEDLVHLFFNDKKVKKDDIHKLYLDFYQFMQFALRKDQDFRLFMRKIKRKYNQRSNNNNNNKSKTNYSANNDNIEEENKYLPMSFNLVLDYFIIKGKERNSKAIIEKGIDEIDKIILKKETKKRQFILDNINEIENIPISEYESQLDKINFVKLIQEFSNLFRIKADKEVSPEGSDKKRGTMNNSFSNTDSVDRTRRNSLSNNIIEDYNSNYNINDYDNNNNKKKDTKVNYVYSGLLSRQLSKENISILNQYNLNKYHSLQLALEETKKVINNQKLQIKQFNSSNIDKCLHYTRSLPELFQKKNKRGRVREIGTYFSKKPLMNKKRDFIPPFILKEIQKE